MNGSRITLEKVRVIIPIILVLSLILIVPGGTVNLYVQSSSRQGPVSWILFFHSMHGVMGIANAQRTLTYLRIITEFVSQDQYRDVVGVSVHALWFSSIWSCLSPSSVGIVNEILWGTVGQVATQSFYRAAYDTLRKSTYVIVYFLARPFSWLHIS